LIVADTFPENYLVPESSQKSVIAWYKAAFQTTQLSARFPIVNDTVGLGLNDGSYTLWTLDGSYNGDQVVSWYFWPKVVSAGQDDFWKTATMGGEIHPVRINENLPN